MAIHLRRKLIIALGMSSAFGFAEHAWAQSGTKAPAGTSKAITQGSSTAKNEASVALSGYCPVCVIEMKK